MSVLIIHSAGPGVTVQDLGRPRHLVQGLSRGGAMDRMALYEGAALLGQAPEMAVLEMVGMGGVFEASAATRIALTGAPMKASLDGAPLIWNASHMVPAGAKLSIGGVVQGAAGYLHVGGGFETEGWLGSRAVQLNAGLGGAVAPGSHLPIGDDAGGPTGMILDVADRCAGGVLRLLPSVQTGFFDEATRTRLETTAFHRDPRSNRMALRLGFEGQGFALEGALTVVSEVIVPGDIQITGDGVPVILMAECQTMGGYPRIATVLPSDLPRAAQTPPGVPLHLHFITAEEGLAAERADLALRKGVRSHIRPLVRDPRDIPDLLRYHLSDGAVSGHEEEHQ
ncbi:biotin-dependent carboxyltransferase [Rhodophyticola sp. CCM32]|uniref:5-oxoprolinase subunit C family protein n=1 Tax=Rhodophyticola sp. CCM32 TaxID=2916397 RepID=UPI00107F1062|nr:biotin-dependent carboxyltransferase family protein [Rhodophyticola sp. CCM32]QBY00854.1 biotin-dependent carboxyltransferase [Rhodophyticola sp. CCM32]